MASKPRIFAADFETTVFDGQSFTEVWSAACVELFTNDVKIFHSIGEQLDYFKSLKSRVVVYYHNLKFDGNFWLSYFLLEKKFKQAYKSVSDDTPFVEWEEDKNMKNNTFKYAISRLGHWYFIKLKIGGKIIEFRDSLKLLPFSLKRIGESFKTEHRKLTMEYKGFRYAGCEITPEEKEYIANDVLVLKEALEIMQQEKHTKLTIGSCCLSEFKSIVGRYEYEHMFPDLTEDFIPNDIIEGCTIDNYIRSSYKGGWCYLVEGKENKIFENGTTADVNSLYPSVMSSESGSLYPVGKPHFWKGNYIPDICKNNNYFFVRIKTKFRVKNGYLPFIQIKNSALYKSNKCLTTSDVEVLQTKVKAKCLNNGVEETNTYTLLGHVKRDGFILNRLKAYYSKNNFEIVEVLDKEFLTNMCEEYYEYNELKNTRVTLTLTMTDYYLFLEHYDVKEFEILDGCWFYARIGIFDEYIDKYKKIKINNKGAKRELAKLFLNNLYGKMASNDDSSFKVGFVREDKSIGFYDVPEHAKKVGYIPVGSAITSYARNFTIRAAQKNYYGADKRGFIYADTDSIHCDLNPDEIKGIKVDDVNFCCWKLESQWDKAIFVRQKTYIEHVTAENLIPLDEDKYFYSVKCAGMPERCKNLFIKSLTGYEIKEEDKFNEEEVKFISQKRELTDFKIGLCVPSKLIPKRIKGGVLLVETTYEMIAH